MEKTDDEKTLRRFLLGLADGAENETIGVRLLEDTNFAENVEYAEHGLVEEFLEGTLDAAEREAFLANFMTSDRRLELVREIAAVTKYAQVATAATAASAASAAEVPSGSFLDRLRALFTPRSLAFAALVVAVACVAGGIWLKRGNSLEAEYAALNAKDLTTAPEAVGATTRSLFGETFRGADAGGRPIRLAESTERILLRLALPAGTAPDARFDAELRSGDRTLRLGSLRVYGSPDAAEARVLVPRQALTAGECEIRLKGAGVYRLRVE